MIRKRDKKLTFNIRADEMQALKKYSDRVEKSLSTAVRDLVWKAYQEEQENIAA
jgi:hypothetical protein